jgi:hypothetical protein
MIEEHLEVNMSEKGRINIGLDMLVCKIIEDLSTRAHDVVRLVQSAGSTKLLNVWAGIIDHLTGPCILPAKLTGPRYLRFIRRHLPHLMEDV